MARCSYCGREVPGNPVLRGGEKPFCDTSCRYSFETNGGKAKEGAFPAGSATGATSKKSKITATMIGAITAAVVVGQLTTGFMQRDFAGLKEFTAPDKSFTVMLPGDVQELKQAVNTKLGPIETCFYTAKAKHQDFTVAYSDFPDSFIAAADPRAMLDGSRDGAVRDIQGKLLGETFIDMKGNPGRELKIEGPQKTIMKSRIYLVKKRMYQIMAVSNSDHAYDKKITEVFGSFRINGI
ncbi:MAG: hypothetical protein ABSF80_05580 [Chitinispirillaceae bacterium]|jgi:hypothetical protein